MIRRGAGQNLRLYDINFPSAMLLLSWLGGMGMASYFEETKRPSGA